MIQFTIVDTIARCVSGNIVADDKGVFKVKFDTPVNGKLVYRIGRKPSQTSKVLNGECTISNLSSGELRGELFVEDKKIMLEIVEIRNFVDQNTNKFTANAQANLILERLADLEKEIATLKQEYEEKYTAMQEKYDTCIDTLKKIKKAYGLGLF